MYILLFTLFNFLKLYIYIYIYNRVISWTKWVKLYITQVRLIKLTNLVFSSFGSWTKFNESIVELSLELCSSCLSSLGALESTINLILHVSKGNCSLCIIRNQLQVPEVLQVCHVHMVCSLVNEECDTHQVD